MRFKFIVMLAVVFGTTVRTKTLDPPIDPANEYEVSLAEADSLSNYFYSVVHKYNQHLECYHGYKKGLVLSLPDYLDMHQGFYQRNAENMHWIELNLDLDSLHSNMYALQAHYNQHLREYHQGVDTTCELVYDLGFPDVEMSEREYLERKVFQLTMMVDKLDSAIEAHIEYHIAPTIPGHEPAEPVLPEPEPREEPRYDPPETSPEEIKEPVLEATPQI